MKAPVSEPAKKAAEIIIRETVGDRLKDTVPDRTEQYARIIDQEFQTLRDACESILDYWIACKISWERHIPEKPGHPFCHAIDDKPKLQQLANIAGTKIQIAFTTEYVMKRVQEYNFDIDI